MRNFRYAIVFFCVFCIAINTGCKKETERLPNVVIIFTDDQGYADVGCYGAKEFTTPNLDRMAEEGMRFTSFYVSQAVCSASRASLLTGCYAERVSIRGALMPWSENGLHPDEMTIAELLKEKGYATAIFGKWHLGHHKEFLPPQHGFDEYFGLPYSNDMWPVDYDGRPLTEKNPGENPVKLFYPVLSLIEGNDKAADILTLDDQATLTTLYTERAVRFIDTHKDQPFFLYVPHSMAHVPLGVSDKFKGKSNQGMYGDVMMEIDWSVGEILKAINRYDLEEDTLIIFASDNGPWLNFGNHAGSAYPLREAKGTAWEGGVRVPCIMRWPGRIPAGAICDKMAATIDVLPTLAAIIGAPLPENTIDGVNILPLLEATESAAPRDHFFFYYGRALRAVRKGQWKLYFPHGFNSYSDVVSGSDGYPGPYNYAQTGLELYDLEKDISETVDVADQFPDIIKELQALADSARDDLGDSLTGRIGKNVRPAGLRWGDKARSVKHLAIGKTISLRKPYSSMYVAGGDRALIDGLRGSTFHNDGFWQGFEGDDLEAVVDLGEVMTIRHITCGFLENQYAWIFFPALVEVSISRDGVSFDLIKHVRNKALMRDIQPRFKDYVTELGEMRTRYIRIKARNVGICPDWHPGAGGKAWLFCDEIIIQ
ncbi:MAG: sulfatase-like hydrolase/transferase [Candidatus Aminicenantes bacterium]